MSFTSYTLRVMKAENGWVVMEGNLHGGEPRTVLVCAGDEPLAETIAAALVAGKLEGDQGKQDVTTTLRTSNLIKAGVDSFVDYDNARDYAKVSPPPDPITNRALRSLLGTEK